MGSQVHYMLEIVIEGIDIFDNPEFFSGRFIEHIYCLAKHGHVLCQQRVELNNTIYCVVIENWEIAEKLLEDTFLIFDTCNSCLSCPQYLYHLIQQRYLTSCQRSSSSRKISEQHLEKN